MTYKNVQNIAIFSIVVLFAVVTFGYSNVYAEEESEYKMADGVEAIFTFTFRDGIETHTFPVFEMDENLVDNSGLSFTVQGVINSAPHLHKALDEAYQYRLQTTGGSSFDYDYRYFEVDIDFVKEGQSIQTLNYHNCGIEDYVVETLRDDQEAYMSSKTGFAIIDQIEFECGGLNSNIDTSKFIAKTSSNETFIEFGKLDYSFANDVRTNVTFEFNNGIEKIEFPYFEITSGFAEETDNVVAEWTVESVVGNYPMLYQAIDKSRQVSGLTSASNVDFNALVEFTRNGTTIRAIDYTDCRVDSAKITTQKDKEDGFTGKSGFALVNQIGFECSGLSPINDNYDGLKFDDVPIWKTAFVSNVQPEHKFPTTNNVHAIATFTHEYGQEIIDFPLYNQGDVLVKSNPTFELAGIVGDTPLLYRSIDQNLKMQSQSGISSNTKTFQVDIELIVDGETVRDFNYSDCRVTNYVVETQRDKEDGYFTGFALENTFDFECIGYTPNSPIYDTMFDTPKADTESTKDLRNTQKWGSDYTVQ